MKAQILREYGPFAGIDAVHGVSFDGTRVWLATGERLSALDPESGEIVAKLDVAGDAGTAFDGRFLWQIVKGEIRKLDPATGEIIDSIPAPGDGDASGMAWAEGSLWIGEYRGRRIFRVEPATGRVLATVEADRFVTGVTWVEGELWHGTWEAGESEVRRIEPGSGAVLERLEMPAGTGVSGMESDGGERFFCGSGADGTVRAVRRPGRP